MESSESRYFTSMIFLLYWIIKIGMRIPMIKIIWILLNSGMVIVLPVPRDSILYICPSVTSTVVLSNVVFTTSYTSSNSS